MRLRGILPSRKEGAVVGEKLTLARTDHHHFRLTLAGVRTVDIARIRCGGRGQLSE